MPHKPAIEPKNDAIPSGSQVAHEFQTLNLVQEQSQQRRNSGDSNASGRRKSPDSLRTGTSGSDSDDNAKYIASETRQTKANDILRQMAPFREKVGDFLKQGETIIPDVMAAKGDELYRKDFSDQFAALKLKVENTREDIPQEHKNRINALNEALKADPEHSIHKLDPKLKEGIVIAQYRGVYYRPSNFDKSARSDHRHAQEIGEPVFASAAFEDANVMMRDYYHAMAHREDSSQGNILAAQQESLKESASKIKEALVNLRQDTRVSDLVKELTNKPQNFKPENVADVATHLYSNNMDKYIKNSDAARERQEQSLPAEPMDRLYQGLPNSRNPYVSTGNIPDHAATYASGSKTYQGHEEDTLNPEYDQDGSRQHPYTGKTYVSLHSLEDYDVRDGATDVVALNNRMRTNIGATITPEREASFLGSFNEKSVIGTFKFKFPDFSKAYKPGHAEKYGMDEELFTAFKEAYAGADKGSPAQVFVDAALSKHLTLHQNLRLRETAMQETLNRNATLVFRDGPHTFAFEPPKNLTDMQKRRNLVQQEKREATKRASSSAARERRPSVTEELDRLQQRGKFE